MITKSKPLRICAFIILVLMMITVIVPFWLMIISSFMPEADIIKEGYQLFPKRLSLETYKYLWNIRSGVARAYLMSVIISAIGVTGNLALTILFAYPLSRKDLPGRNIISFFLFFTMLFNGGLVPTYIIYSRVIHIKNTLWAMIVPSLLLNAFNVIMMRTYITSNIPDEIIEAARIDGAGEGRCLISIVLPMCKPIVGTLGFLNFIAYWNNWTNGVYYVPTNTGLWGIQNYLNNIMDNANAIATQSMQNAADVVLATPTQGIRMAIAVIAVLPVLLVYPFFQKSFVKGITVGSVKG